uniref:Uncharacterized protein n=1 Tax=viral metagenome TaxID=1070528 RepID=A0A6C0C0L8_9ZZZZ
MSSFTRIRPYFRGLRYIYQSTTDYPKNCQLFNEAYSALASIGVQLPAFKELQDLSG